MTTESLKLMLERHRQVKVDHSSRRRVSQDGRIYYQQKYSPVFVSCLKSTDHADTSPVSFVAAIGADGRVLRSTPIMKQTFLLVCGRRCKRTNFHSRQSLPI